MPTKISALPAASTLTGTETVPLVQSSTTKGGLISQIGTYVRALFTTTPATLAEGGTGAATAATARSSLEVVALAGDTMIGGLIFKAGLNNIASATPNLSAAGANTVHVTGITGITAFTMTSGQVVDLVFDGILLLTHHATNNNLPGAANITTAAGDRARYWYDGTTKWCVDYQKADGTAVVATTTSAASQAEVDAGTVSTKYIPPSLRKISMLATQATTSGTTKDFTIPAGARQITVMFNGVSTNNTSPFLIQIGDAGGIENTGYLAMCDLAGGSIAGVTSTVGFIVVRVAVAASLYQGKAVLDLVDPATFTWLSSSLITDNSNGVHVAAGSKALSAELTTVRVTSGTPDTFDAGLVGVSYIL